MLTQLLTLTLLVLSEFSGIAKARSVRMEAKTENIDGGKYWKPVNGTRTDWINCRGLPCDQWRRSKDKIAQLVKDFELSSESSGANDVLLTENQVDELRRLTRADGKPIKWKRATAKSSFEFWKLPIYYMFDGYHSEMQRQAIRDALQHWMDNSCIRFVELPVHQVFTDHHILFTREPQGCFSYTGMIAAIPQQVNLEDQCLQTFGKAVHEIGHVLGLWHEQQRKDRDESVEVLDENIGIFKNQFSKHWEVPEEVPYEHGSVMHYASKDGSRNGETTLRARNPLYQRNMGQRTGLSFGDSKYTNMVYCNDICKTRLRRPCEHGGYQDPNSCHTCKCPDGFSGDFCQKLAKPVNGVCGGVIELSAGGEERKIESPGYVEDKMYEPHTSCTWLIKAPVGHRIQIRFVDEFGLYCHDDTCYHWVEVRFQRNLATEGPRFCCESRPVVTMTSESNEMMVVFRSNWTIEADDDNLRGFRAVVKTVPSTSMERRFGSTHHSAESLPPISVDSPAVTFDATNSDAVTSSSIYSDAVTVNAKNSDVVTSSSTDSRAVTFDSTDSPAIVIFHSKDTSAATFDSLRPPVAS